MNMLADYSAKATVGALATPLSLSLDDEVRAIPRLRFNLVRALVQTLNLVPLRIDRKRPFRPLINHHEPSTYPTYTPNR